MTGIQEGVCLSAPLKDKGGDVSRLGNLGPSWNSGRDWDKEEDRWEGGSPPQRGSGCSWPEGGVCCRHVRACARNATTDKARPGGGGGRGPGARAPPARGAAAGRGAARGGGCARTGPSPPPFCFLGTMGESNGRAREQGWQGRNEPGARARGLGGSGERGAPQALSPRLFSRSRAEWEEGRGEGERRERARPPPH